VLVVAALIAVGFALAAARVGHEAEAVATACAALGAFLALWLLVLSIHLVGDSASR
jgi:hypothetical protein